MSIYKYIYIYINDQRAAVRETDVSRHHGGPIEGPLKPPVHHCTMVLSGLKKRKGNESIVFYIYILYICMYIYKYIYIRILG